MVDGPITRTSTQVGKIGINLAELAKRKDTIDAGEFGTVPSLDIGFGDENGTEAQKAVHAICQALSLSEIKKNAAVWELEAPIGPNKCDEIKEKFKVKLVFEEAGEAILLVPDKHNLEFGLQDPPMSEFGYILRLTGTINAAKRLLQALSDEIKSLPGIDGTSLEGAVKSKTDYFIANRPELQPLSPNEEIDFFHDQLGAYSCRQCG